MHPDIIKRNVDNGFRSQSFFFFALGFTLINIIFFTLFISSSAYFFGVEMSFWNFPLAVICAIIVIYRLFIALAPEYKKIFFIRTVICILSIVLLSIFLANFIFDTSADGLVYHQEAVYQLKNGWNPVYNDLPDSVSQAIWINHYPKAAEIPQAAIYKVTGHIESGKATNLFLLFATIFLTTSALLQIKRFSTKWAIFLSLLFTLNPVCINQIFTFYLDGQVSNLLLCFLSASVLFISRSNKYYLLLLFSIIIITANLKFTGIIFCAIFSIGLVIYCFIIKDSRLGMKVFYTCFLAGLIAIVFVGYNPYLKNTISYHHPFYPLMGKGSIDIIKESYPIGFSEKGQLEKFYISFFSHTDNEGSWPWEERVPTLKVPFSVNRVDIINARTEDTRIAGFGPLFSGIFLLALLFFIISNFFFRKYRFVNRIILYCIIIIIFSVSIIPEAWWARYVPQFWLLPLLMVLSFEFINNKAIVIFKWLFYILIVINISFSLFSIPYHLLKSSQLSYQLAQFKASKQDIKVKWGNARSNRIRFIERGIHFKEADLSEEESVEIIGSDSRAIMPKNLPYVSKPFYLKMWRRLRPSD